jgi:hypothetical protein
MISDISTENIKIKEFCKVHGKLDPNKDLYYSISSTNRVCTVCKACHRQSRQKRYSFNEEVKRKTNEHNKKAQKERIKNLDDYYMLSLLKKSLKLDYKADIKNIPEHLVVLKRASMMLRRFVRNGKREEKLYASRKNKRD